MQVEVKKYYEKFRSKNGPTIDIWLWYVWVNCSQYKCYHMTWVHCYRSNLKSECYDDFAHTHRFDCEFSHRKTTNRNVQSQTNVNKDASSSCFDTIFYRLFFTTFSRSLKFDLHFLVRSYITCVVPSLSCKHIRPFTFKSSDCECEKDRRSHEKKLYKMQNNYTWKSQDFTHIAHSHSEREASELEWQIRQHSHIIVIHYNHILKNIYSSCLCRA